MMFDITPIIEAVVALIAVIVTTYVVPYIKTKTSSAQQKEINAWVAIAVSAAEQIYTGTGKGQEKKEYVLQWLKDHDVVMDAATIDLVIESAVYELKHGVIS